MKLANLCLVATALAACHCAHESRVTSVRRDVHEPGPEVPPPAGAISVKSFGAKGDGATDDRAAFQAALDAAASGNAELYVPPGTYVIDAQPRALFGLAIRGTVHLRGAGQDRTVLQQAAGAHPSARLINVSGDRVVIEDLTLDGNRAAQQPGEQRHGLFITDTGELEVRRVTARNFTGDGFYLYHNASGSRFTQVVATGNGRNGLTLGGMVNHTEILDSKFVGNTAQQVDSEPGGNNVVSNTTITGSLLDNAGASKDYALTCSGTGGAKGHDWTVTHNTINGPIFIVWADHVTIADNTGTNVAPKSFITINRSSSDITIRHNKLVQAQRDAAFQAGVYVVGTKGSSPERILITDNDIETTFERGYGVRATGATSIEITGNRLRGAGRPAAGFAGIYLRATLLDRDFRSAVMRGNTIRNFGELGVSVVGNGAAKLLSVDVSNNTFEDDSAVPSMTTAISLDDGSGAAQKVQVDGNTFKRGVRDRVINYPAHAIREGRGDADDRDGPAPAPEVRDHRDPR